MREAIETGRRVILTMKRSFHAGGGSHYLYSDMGATDFDSGEPLLSVVDVQFSISPDNQVLTADMMMLCDMDDKPLTGKWVSPSFEDDGLTVRAKLYRWLVAEIRAY